MTDRKSILEAQFHEWEQEFARLRIRIDADADARGVVGPNLNQLCPSLTQVESAIAQGVGAMPAYGAQLSENEIAALAAYVVEATR